MRPPTLGAVNLPVYHKNPSDTRQRILTKIELMQGLISIDNPSTGTDLYVLHSIASSKKKNQLSIICQLSLLFAVPVVTYADAWTQAQGHGQLVLTSSFFETSKFFDTSGKVQRFDYDGAFRKFELNPYFEYGLSPRSTLIVNAYIPFLKFSNQYGSQNSVGLGDIEAGIRRRLNSSESILPISAQVSMMFPAYSTDRNPAPGNHQVDVETRFMVGRSANLFGYHAFWNLGSAYRFRAGAPADQFRSDATLGVSLNHRFMVTTQFFGITGMRNGQVFQIGNNPNAQSDFDLYKGQLSLVTRLRKGLRVQLGWNNAIAGRNTGRGQGFLVSFWQDF